MAFANSFFGEDDKIQLIRYDIDVHRCDIHLCQSFNLAGDCELPVGIFVFHPLSVVCHKKGA